MVLRFNGFRFDETPPQGLVMIYIASSRLNKMDQLMSQSSRPFTPLLPCPVACCSPPSSACPRMVAPGTLPAPLRFLQLWLLPGLALGTQRGAPGTRPVQAAGTSSAIKLEPCWGVLAGSVEEVHLEFDTGFGDLFLGHGKGASCKWTQGWVVWDWGRNTPGALTCTGLTGGACLPTRRMKRPWQQKMGQMLAWHKHFEWGGFAPGRTRKQSLDLPRPFAAACRRTCQQEF